MVIIMDVHSSDHGHGCLPIVTNDNGNIMNANYITTTTNPRITNIMFSNQPPTSPQTSCKKSLGLLAEAAALRRKEDLEDLEKQKLEISKRKNNNDNDNNNNTTTEQSSTNKETATTTNQTYTLKQVKKFSDKRLITTFVEYKKDIKTKRCSYRCQMLPLECQCKFDSCIGADQESKTQILEHVRSHLRNLESTMPNIKLSSFRKKKIRKNNKTKTSSAPTGTTTTGAIATKTNILKKSDDLDYTCSNKMTNVPMIFDNNNKIVEIGKINFGDIVESKNFVTVINPQPQPGSVVVATAAPTNVTATTQPIIETSPSGVISSDLSLLSLQQSPNNPASQARIRELALIYIDDIRKKNSSSTSKSVIKNGNKKNVIHQCNFCPDKQFTSLNGLVFHYKKHAGLKPYVCDRCGATFTRQHSLNYHTLIHLNQARFNCPDCSRRFRHPSHFKEHMRRHTGETPFQCEDCLIRFKTRNTYKRHLQTKHSKILTSKGIIELSDSYPNNNKDSNKKTPKVIASKTGGGSTTKKSTINEQASTSTINVTTITKPRRKYAINSLYKNIETQNKFEQQQFQQQHPTAATLITHTTANPAMLAAVQADSCHHVLASHHHGQQTAIAATAQTAPGSNITILSMPVHILDSNGGSTASAPIISTIPAATGRSATIARKTLLNYNNFNQIATPATALAAGQPTNIIVYHQPHHSFHRQDENGKTVLTPIQITTNPANTNEQTFIIKTESDQTSCCNLITELTTAAPLISNTATYTNRSNHPVTIKQENEIIINQPTTTTAPPITNNENFMRLLEAIEIAEEGGKL